eukprot:SAG31_NODE_10018_length_1194_cov_2.225571_1_plen_219_part_10
MPAQLASFTRLRTHSERDDPVGADVSGQLTPDEICFFKKNGFLVKRRLIPKHALLPQQRRIYSELEARQPTVKRSEPSTLVDPQRHWTSTAGPAVTADGQPTARNWPMTFTASGDWNWHALGSEPDWLEATSAHPAVLRTVESIIGRCRRPTRNRGIYVMFPHGNPGTLSPHHDYHPFDLGGLVRGVTFSFCATIREMRDFNREIYGTNRESVCINRSI